MNPNPFSDTITFLVQPGLMTAIFWVLLVASAAIALYVYRTIPGQRVDRMVSQPNDARLSRALAVVT